MSGQGSQENPFRAAGGGGGQPLSSTPVTPTGDVFGPAVSVLNRIAVFADTTGKLIADGLVTVADILAQAGDVDGPASSVAGRIATFADGLYSIADILALIWPRTDLYGAGSDGNLTAATGTTTLARDMYYDVITLSGDAVINTNGYRLHWRSLVVISAGTYYIHRNGIAGGNGSALTPGTGALGLVRGTLGPSFFGGDGAGGAAGGGDGLPGNVGEGDLSAGGGDGGTSPAGGDSAVGTGGVGGIAVAAATAVGNVFFGSFVRDLVAWTGRTVATLLGGGAGGAGGSSGGSYSLSTDKSGGGGGGASGAAPLWFAGEEVVTSVNTPAGVIRAIGGRGGNAGAGSGANSGGSAGGGGGGGGKIQGYIGKVTGVTVTNFFDASGGAAGTPSAPRGTGIAVVAAGGGKGGNITIHYLADGSVTQATPVAPVGTAGGISKLDLVA
jgi:hypothetical protein